MLFVSIHLFIYRCWVTSGGFLFSKVRLPRETHRIALVVGLLRGFID